MSFISQAACAWLFIYVLYIQWNLKLGTCCMALGDSTYCAANIHALKISCIFPETIFSVLMEQSLEVEKLKDPLLQHFLFLPPGLNLPGICSSFHLFMDLGKSLGQLSFPNHLPKSLWTITVEIVYFGAFNYSLY